MFNLKTSPRIQKLVTQIPSSRLHHVADLSVDVASNITEKTPQNAHFHGMADALVLAGRLINLQKKGVKAAGLYVATQPNGNGNDYYYFVGTIKSITEKLNDVRTDMACGVPTKA